MSNVEKGNHPLVVPELDSVLLSSSAAKIRSEDGEIFLVDPEEIVMSLFLQRAYKQDASRLIQLPHKINAATFRKVLEYLRYHRHSTGLSEKDIKNWDAEFVKVDSKLMCELASAAYYLDIKPLVDLTCKAIASVIAGKTAEEIRQTFNIHNDFEGDEEAQLPVYYATRGRSRNKMHCIKRKPKNKNAGAATTPLTEDDRSVDDLLQYIEGKKDKKKSSKGKSSPSTPLSTPVQEAYSSSGRSASVATTGSGTPPTATTTTPTSNQSALATPHSIDSSLAGSAPSNGSGSGKSITRDIARLLLLNGGVSGLAVPAAAAGSGAVSPLGSAELPIPAFWSDQPMEDEFEEDDDMPADMKEQLDREVEEFRARLAVSHVGSRLSLTKC